MDQGSKPGTWIETSSGGMFISAISTAIERRYVDRSYRTVARKAWQGLQRYIETDAEGKPVFTEAVQGMGIQVSFERYVGMQRLRNSTHGLVAIQLAASRME
jgi:unsaturated rhamnogalacturonyl hydrolase